MTARTTWPARDLALVAAFAGLIAVLGLPGAISVPIVPVPITAQTLAVMLAGLILGPRLGAASVVLFLVLVAIGLPLLAGGRGGWQVFLGPSAGYLIGWVFGAAVTGFLSRRTIRGIADRGVRQLDVARLAGASLIGGVAVVYVFGIPVLALRTGVSLSQAAVGAMVFLPGDLVKAVLASVIGAAVVRSYPPVVAHHGVR